MYERFSDRARSVMQSSNEVANRFGQEFIEPEHSLYALIEKEQCVAREVLDSLNIEVDQIRSDLQEILENGKDFEDLSRRKQSAAAKKVIQFAMEEARSLEHHYIGTEHLLMGLLRDDISPAGELLANHNVRLDDVRSQALNILDSPLYRERNERLTKQYTKTDYIIGIISLFVLVAIILIVIFVW